MLLKNALIDHPRLTNFKFLFACYEFDQENGLENTIKQSLILNGEKLAAQNRVFEVAYEDLPPSLQKKLSDEIGAGIDTNVCFRIFNLIGGHLIAEKDVELNELLYDDVNWDAPPADISVLN